MMYRPGDDPTDAVLRRLSRTCTRSHRVADPIPHSRHGPHRGRRLSKEVRHALRGLLVIIWAIVGAVAAGQRGYFTHASQNCASTGTIALTVIAGPLN